MRTMYYSCNSYLSDCVLVVVGGCSCSSIFDFCFVRYLCTRNRF
jgi:hypothetical protein